MRRLAQRSLPSRLAAMLCAAAFAAGCVVLWHAGPARASTGTGRSPEVLTYASPVELLFSPDGTRLYVLCQESEEVACSMRRPTRRSRTFRGHVPRGFSLSHDGTRLFVANTWDDTISVIDTRVARGRRHLAGRRGTIRRCRGPRGQALVCGQPHFERRGRARCADRRGREAAGGGARRQLHHRAPDGTRLYATHVYPNPPRVPTPGGNRVPPESEITVIDAARAVVVDRIPLDRIAHSFHTAFSADGRLGVTAQPASQESRSPRAPGTRRRIRRHAHAVWRGCGQAGGSCRSMNWSAMRCARSAWRFRRTSRASMSPAKARRS